MLSSYIVGTLLLVAIAAGWLAVQQAWLRVFGAPAVGGRLDPDPLAGRLGCQGCDGHCSNSCEEER